MKTVKKANKVLTIADEMLEGYLKEGYDEIDEKGNVKTASPSKTYTAAEVKKLTADSEKKIAELTAEYDKLKKRLAKKGDDAVEKTEESKA